MMRTAYHDYTEYLFKLFRIEDELKLNAHSKLPKLDALYDEAGRATQEQYFDDKVGVIIERRNEEIIAVVTERYPALLSRVRDILYPSVN